MHTLDKAATDLVSAFHYEHQPETVEEGLGIVRKILDNRQKQIDSLEGHIRSLTLKLQEQKDWSSKLTTEVLELKETNERLEKELEELKQRYHRETFEQSTRIEQLENENKKFQRKVKAMESYYSKEIKEREEEMSHMKKEVAIAERMQDNAEREKNKMADELDTVRDRTRKLLVSLGLENEVRKLDMSVDHARNIAIATRRKGAVGKMNTKMKLSPIAIGEPSQEYRASGEDQLFNNLTLPWGNTPQDIQARRDSVAIEQMFPPSIPKAVEGGGTSGHLASVTHHGNHSDGEFMTPRKSAYRKLPPVGEQ